MRKFSHLVYLFVFISSFKTFAQQEDLASKIDTYLQLKLKSSNIPGFTVAVLSKEKVLLAKGYGVSGNGRLTADTPLPIASLSKAFTALSILQLAEQNKIDLNALVTVYYTDFPLRNSKITVKSLLNQTSGLSDKIFPEMKFSEQPKTLEEAIERLKNVNLKSEETPGFHYHNPNYLILAAIIEKVSGMSYSEYLQKNIFKPLKLANTSNVSLTNEIYRNPEVPVGYNFYFGLPLQMKERNWFVEGSAGIISSANDMAKWLSIFLQKENLMGNEILSIDNLQRMLTPSGVSGSMYGMGWSIIDKSKATHSGMLWTYQSRQLLLMDKGYAVVVLFDSGLNIFQDYDSLMNGIEQILRGQNPDVFNLNLYLEIFAALILGLIIFIFVKRIRRLKKWQKPAKIILPLILKLIPLMLLLSLPKLLEVFTDRVLSWPRLFWLMPEVITILILSTLLNFIVIVFRLKHRYKG